MNSSPVITKSIRLAPDESQALRQNSEAEHVSETAMMKKFVLEGTARYRLEQAVAARYAETSVYHMMEELKARDADAASEKFLEGLRTLAELFGGSEALNRTLVQLNPEKSRWGLS